MSDTKMTPGATPSKRLTMKEFLKEHMQKLDSNHTACLLKKIKTEKELERIKEQVTMHEGAVLFLKQLLSEWAVYENDTVKLRQAEERARTQQQADKIAEAQEKKPKRIRRKKNTEDKVI